MTMQAIEPAQDGYVFFGSADIEFPLSKFDQSIRFRELEIHQDMYEHDLAILRARSKNLDWTTSLYPGTPVKITYRGKRTTGSAFYGYVTHVKPKAKMVNELFEVEIFCVASSRDLRETGQHVWRNKTAPEIAAWIAKRFKYRLVSKQHPFRKPQTMQSGQTYWEFLTRLAKDTGYILRVEGGTMFFLPFEDMVLANVARAPKLMNYERLDEDGQAIPRNVLSMQVWGGDTDLSPTKDADDALVVSVPPTGGSITPVREGGRSAVRRRRQPSRYVKYRSGTVAHTARDAKVLASSHAAMSQIAIDADAAVEGDGYFAPYRPVYVRMRDKSMNQWWIVKSVKHKINFIDARYQCDLVLSSDSIEPSTLPKPPKRRVRNVREEQRQGWSPSTLREPRLFVTRSGFVVGKTKHGETTARWIGL